MVRALKSHWPEYAMEALALGLFMLSASLFAALIGLPSSPVRRAVEDPLARRALMGLAMGATAIAIVYSPFGRRSGAHMNPAVTLAFLRLGKVARADACFYVLFQFAGGVAGMLAAAALLGGALAHPSVNYVVTVPGAAGLAAAFAAELAISFALFSVVLRMGASQRRARFTGLAVGALVAAYIAFEEPLSGMSMNPARTFASALNAGVWDGWWIYLTAPTLGMLAAVELHLRWPGARAVRCAKLHHCDLVRCIHCGAHCGA